MFAQHRRRVTHPLEAQGESWGRRYQIAIKDIFMPS